MANGKSEGTSRDRGSLVSICHLLLCHLLFQTCAAYCSTVRRNGRLVDAVAQTTKGGFVFVFDRETGKPLFPVEYRKVPASDVDGEVLAGTQPFPLKPPPYARQVFTEDMVTDRTPEAHAAVLERLRKLRNRGQFTPPSLL